MIKLTPNPTFPCDVRLTVHGQDEPAIVPMMLAYMTADERVAWFEKNKGVPVKDALGDIVKGWDPEHVQDEAGQPTPFSAQALTQLVTRYEASPSEIMAAWSKHLTESRVKN